jgi:hypothetical protein
MKFICRLIEQLTKALLPPFTIVLLPLFKVKFLKFDILYRKPSSIDDTILVSLDPF